MATGSHHEPFSHANGTSGRHTLATGSHHEPFAHCAELTAGVATVTAANGANTTALTTARRWRVFRTASLLSEGTFWATPE